MKKKLNSGRDGSRFVAFPFVLLDSPAYMALSFSAKALLIDIARQYSGANNGRLTICEKVLAPRGWNSNATIHKAKKELLHSGLLCETRKGAKPNKASWFALTWQRLDWDVQMDIARTGFSQGSYLKNNFRPPENGVEEPITAPETGVEQSLATPKNGAMRG
jgi:hypothetical protein